MLKAFLFIILIMVLNGCSANGRNDNPLNPDKPITVTVWHYYNGNIKEKFDAIVTEFNETVGMEYGIVIDSQSQGDVNQLATAVFDAANKSIGAAPMPDIFASYPDNAFRVSQIIDLVSLDSYFSTDELSEYRVEFLEEGRFQADKKLFIMPIAKSSENLYVNKNGWESFATAHGYTETNLKTWEGLYEVSKTYYEETGKSFYSIDASANFMLNVAMQYGTEMYQYNSDGTATFNMTKEVAHKIWDYYYRPYINGYYIKTGRFSSDDAKTGNILAYTGSTAGAAYFPTEVTQDGQGVEEIEPLVLPYPSLESGEQYSIQQGAGMCITKSDEAHEYAASVFLKWFTDAAQNIEFAVTTGYFPVKNEALKEDVLLDALDKAEVTNPAIKASVITTNKMFQTYTLYNSKPFSGSYEIRTILETHLFEKVTNDLEILKQKVSNGENRSQVIETLLSEDAFEAWYQDILQEVDLILK